MKKFACIFIALVLAFGLLYLLCNNKTENYRVEITDKTAVEIARNKLNDKEIETIINLDNPKVEKLKLNKNAGIYYFEKKDRNSEHDVYKVTFNTEQDGFLGPIVYYVDVFTGNITGTDFRE